MASFRVLSKYHGLFGRSAYAGLLQRVLLLNDANLGITSIRGASIGFTVSLPSPTINTQAVMYQLTNLGGLFCPPNFKTLYIMEKFIIFKRSHQQT